jgi:hypothetical protein
MFMKIKRLLGLQIGMALVLLIYLAFAGYLLFKLPTQGLPLRFTSTIAEQQVRTDALPQLQSDFRLAISYLAEIENERNELLLACVGASLAVVIFLGWSIFIVSRIKREVDHVA